MQNRSKLNGQDGEANCGLRNNLEVGTAPRLKLWRKSPMVESACPLLKESLSHW